MVKSYLNKPISYLPSYSSKDFLAEAIIIGGVPFFIVKRNGKDATIEKSLTIADRVLLPPSQPLYLSRPYVFCSKKVVFDFLKRAKLENIDTLYRKAKGICAKYIDADSNHIALVATDVILAYYQDKLGLTHYLFFVAHPGSGKTNNLDVIHMLAYRNFMGSD